ncbi:MAG: hypothetical protein WAM08_20915, partial [Candidatus Acidiferrales bacterium]
AQEDLTRHLAGYRLLRSVAVAARLDLSKGAGAAWRALADNVVAIADELNVAGSELMVAHDQARKLVTAVG